MSFSLRFSPILTQVKSNMKITFIGTGEACDKNRKNISVLLDDGHLQHLLDCGFSSSFGYLQQAVSRPLSSIWISHFHGDHFFGVAQLIVLYYQQKREEPLTIISGAEGSEKINGLIDLAFPGLLQKLPYPLRFVQLHQGQKLEHDDLIWQSAPTIHSTDSFSLKIENSSHSIYYSGDGKPTKQGEKLMSGCDFVIHEAFSLNSDHPAHCSIEECLDFAKRLEIAKLALVHINKQTWQQLDTEAPLKSPGETVLFFPEDGDIINLQ